VLIVSVVAVAVGLALSFSAALTSIEVFIKPSRRGETLGLAFSLLAVPLYLVAFCDRLPGRPIRLRDTLLVMPGVTKAAAHFGSSILILVVLVMACVLRFAIYARLHINPASAATTGKSGQQDKIRQRVSDLTSPILAYFTFASVLTAIIAGAYALPAFAGAAIMLGLVMVYLFSPAFLLLSKSVLWLAIQTRIAIRRFWLLGSTVLVYTILVIGRLETWRRRLQPRDELFFAELEARLRMSRQKAHARIEHERELLRSLTPKHDELIVQGASTRVSKPAHSSSAGMALAEEGPPADSMQLVVYADIDEHTAEWQRLSSASVAVAEALGYARESQLPTEYGSVFQRAFWRRIATSEEARQYEALLQQAFGLKAAMLNQAEVDSKQAAAAADLIGALAAVPTACIKVGSLLLIKYRDSPDTEPVVLVRSLSSREIQAIDRYPAILKHPHTALDALNMAITAAESPETTSNDLGPE
jgi:hypothetical protein